MSYPQHKQGLCVDTWPSFIAVVIQGKTLNVWLLLKKENEAWYNGPTMEQNKNYIYTIVIIGLIVIVGLFVWNMQTANSPEETQTEQNNQQQGTDQENEGGTDDSVTNGEGDTNGSAEDTSGEGNTGNSNGQSDTNGDTGGGGETNSTEDDPTAQWRTYKNTSLGITFKLPAEWRVTENSQAGEYTIQVYEGTSDNKTTRVNILIYPTEIDVNAEAGAKTTVNGQEAYVYTNVCKTGNTCTMNKTTFPVEGQVSGGVWSGSVVEITAITEQSETATLRDNITNLISSVSLN